MTDINHFSNDDAGYEQWLATHPDGYVLNTTRLPSKSYLKGHRAGCPSITHLQRDQTTWTSGQYMKVCADSLDALGSWARQETGGTIDACGMCKP